jgi:hypothetical protein
MSGKLGRKMEQAVAALLSEPTIEAAALQAGVSCRCLKNWLAEPEFQALYRAARHDFLERTTARLLALCGESLDALAANLKCDKPAAVNGAALGILDRAVKGVETLDLIARIEELERKAGAGQ